MSLLRHLDQDVPPSVQTSLTAAGYHIDEITLEGSLTGLRPRQDIIAILDLASPFFSSLDQNKFALFQRLINAAKEGSCGVLWLTGSCQIGDVTNPDYAPILGAARVLRNDVQLDFATLELDGFEVATKAVPVVFAQFQKRISETDIDTEHEWAYVDGRALISRYFYVKIDHERESTLPAESFVRRLSQRKPGVLNSLYWKALAAPALQDDEVRIEVKATGVNSKVRNL